MAEEVTHVTMIEIFYLVMTVQKSQITTNLLLAKISYVGLTFFKRYMINLTYDETYPL